MTLMQNMNDQMSTENNILVAVRIRPLSSKEIHNNIYSCCQALSDQAVSIRKNPQAGRYLKSEQGSINEYSFDIVFGEQSPQREVYEKTTKPYIENLLNGYNLTVFAYGATGSGKTYTMMGNNRRDSDDSTKIQVNNSDAGIIPNALLDVFQHISQRQRNSTTTESWQVVMSYLEVYNEQVYDLIESSNRTLSLREDPDKGIVLVSGLTEKIVQSPDQVLRLLYLGNQNRRTEATDANAVSSRSHAVLQLTIRHTKRNGAGREVHSDTKLSLIDLAGSERASATNNRGVRLYEGANINKSLLALANCINALSENSHNNNHLQQQQQQHNSTSSISPMSSNTNSNTNRRVNVKYRDSKLTHLLKSSLEGRCKVVMIAAINPSHISFEDSHNTLKYANRAKNIKVNTSAVQEVTAENSWREREQFLCEENKRLRERVRNLEQQVFEMTSTLQEMKSLKQTQISSDNHQRGNISAHNHHEIGNDDNSSNWSGNPQTQLYSTNPNNHSLHPQHQYHQFEPQQEPHPHHDLHIHENLLKVKQQLASVSDSLLSQPQHQNSQNSSNGNTLANGQSSTTSRTQYRSVSRGKVHTRFSDPPKQSLSSSSGVQNQDLSSQSSRFLSALASSVAADNSNNLHSKRLSRSNLGVSNADLPPPPPAATPRYSSHLSREGSKHLSLMRDNLGKTQTTNSTDITSSNRSKSTMRSVPSRSSSTNTSTSSITQSNETLILNIRQELPFQINRSKHKDALVSCMSVHSLSDSSSQASSSSLSRRHSARILRHDMNVVDLVNNETVDRPRTNSEYSDLLNGLQDANNHRLPLRRLQSAPYRSLTPFDLSEIVQEGVPARLKNQPKQSRKDPSLYNGYDTSNASTTNKYALPKQQLEYTKDRDRERAFR